MRANVLRGAVRVLLIDQLVGVGEKKVGIAKALHDEQSLRLTADASLGEPVAQAPLVDKLRLSNPLHPRIDAFASLLLQEADPHLAVRRQSRTSPSPRMPASSARRRFRFKW